MLGLLVFVYFDEYKDYDLNYLVMFGLNPFLSYFIAEFIYQVPFLLLDDMSLGLELAIMAIIIIVVSLVNWHFYKKKKRISTEKVALIFLVIVFALSFVI